MSIHIEIFCRKADVVPRRRLIEFVRDGALIDGPLRSKPALGDPDVDVPAWDVLVLHAGAQEVQIERVVETGYLRELVAEAVGHAAAHETNAALLARLRECRQVFHIDLGSDPPEDVWEAIDALEALIAREFDGVIRADEGFYDAELQRIA